MERDGSTKPVSAIYCTDNDLAGGGGGGDYGGHEGPRDPGANPAPPVKTTQEFLENEKLNCIWIRLNNNMIFKKSINKFDSEFSLANLVFDVSSSLPSNVNGRTDNSNPDNITIFINENTLNEKAVLNVARTMFHEAIHAESYRKVRSVNNKIDINDFPGIYDYYMRYMKNWQHQQMAAHYIDIMGQMLKEFDNGKMSLQYYKDIAWNGLYKIEDKNNPGNYIYTTAFNELTSIEQQRILQNISNLNKNGNKTCN